MKLIASLRTFIGLDPRERSRRIEPVLEPEQAAEDAYGRIEPSLALRRDAGVIERVRWSIDTRG